ncbi:MAG: phage portal protein [Thermoleophilia bacterium]|nr:phage portal protein [Thermoleophilia bacterium]
MAKDKKTPLATATILEAPKNPSGESQQINLGQWNYDEHECVPPPLDLKTLAGLYSRNVPHKACVDAKTVNCVGLGYRLDPKEGADEDRAKEWKALIEDWLDLCARRDDKTFEELLTAARKDEESVGFGAIEISRKGSGMIDGLYHVHAFTIRRRKARDGWVQNVDGEYRYFRQYGKRLKDTQAPARFKGRNEILVVGETSPDSPFYPLPDHAPALGDIAGDEAAQLYQLQFFKNNAVPRIAICVDGGKLDPDTKDFILKYLAEGIRGEAHKTLLIETEPGAGLKVHIEKLAVEGRTEADFMDYRTWARDAVIMAHRVSPSKVTIVENANLANSKDQDKTFKEQVIKPDQNRWEKRIQWLLEDEFGADFPLRFQFVEMDLQDEEQIARTHSYYAGAATNNEVREWAGLREAGIDPETGAVTDPVLEAWGKQPFENPPAGLPQPTDKDGSPLPVGKRVSPELKTLRKMAADFGYLIEWVQEVDREGNRTLLEEPKVHEPVGV